MFQFSQKMLAGLLLSSVSAMLLPVAHADLQERMQEALSSAIAGGMHVSDLAKVQAGLGNVVALHGMRMDDTGITLTLTGAPKFNAFTTDNGMKLQVDLRETLPLGIQDSLDAMGHAEKFDVDLVSLEPILQTRLTLNFSEPVGFYEIAENGSVSLAIQPKSKALSAKMLGASSQVDGMFIRFEISNLEHEQKPLLAISKESHRNLDNVAEQFKNILPGESVNADTQHPIANIEAVGKARVDFTTFQMPFDAADEDGVEVADAENAEVPVEETSTFPNEPAEAEEEEVRPPMPRIDIAPVTSSTNTEMTSIIIGIESGEAEELGGSVIPSTAGSAQPTRSSLAMDTSKPRFVGDPLNQLVNVDFREMELSNVVALLAHKAGINVIAGTDLVGVVTANLRNVTLRRAMEEALRMNGLGMIEDGGIYRIVTINEKMATDRVREIVDIDNALAQDIAKILNDITKGSLEAPFINIAFNEQKNVIILSGPTDRVAELRTLAKQLDVAEPKLQTVTELFKLNYADPAEVGRAIDKQLSSQGKIGVDARARQLVVTDDPVVVEHLRQLVAAMDTMVKQVVIESMIADIVLRDEASTGVDWLLSAVRSLNQRGEIIGSLQELSHDTNLGLQNVASALNFGVLTGNINWAGVVQAEVRNQNGRVHSNPVVVTMENQPARIGIAQEVPFVELKSTDQGGQQTTTEFKEIGTILEVTPRVTHDNDILVTVYVKESNVSGEFNGIPIESIRDVKTNLRTGNGQTIFIGGLRKNTQDTSIRKVPILGDVPVFNVMFRQNSRNQAINELMVFMTNTVLEERKTDLDNYQQMKFDAAKSEPLKVDAQNALLHDMVYPHEMRDPSWKFRRSE